MARTKSSKRWLNEHFADTFVHQAKKEGYRSRAAYKLLEIQKKDNIMKPGMNIIDLGAAPGGWSQVARQFVGTKGHVFALDILPMESLADVEFIQGDFTDEQVLKNLLQTLDNRPVDLVLSDMAPNITGVKAVDQPKSIYLVELAFDLARMVLHPGGTVLVKVFQGEGFEQLIKNLRKEFTSVVSRKPQASRDRSPEMYILAKGIRK